MHVPTISELTAAFGEVPESVAEVGVGRYLTLDAWPAGEVLVVSSVAGRSLRVYINPEADRVRVQISSPSSSGPTQRSTFVRAELSDDVSLGRERRSPGDPGHAERAYETILGGG